MYLNHFGLAQQPFQLTPDTTLFFSGSERGAALKALQFTVEEGIGITKVIGEIGTGKTMLCHMLARNLPRHIDVIYIVNPSLSPIEMLVTLAIEMNIPAQESWPKTKLMHALMHHLLLRFSQKRQVVVLIEEAQAMPIDTLEEIRLLSNLETGQSKLLQIILFGQPELDDHLNQQNIRQLKDRIHYQFYLKPFTFREVETYLHHRLSASGYSGSKLFSESAIKSLQKYSKGLARRINLLADKSMLIAFANNRKNIRSADVKEAAEDSLKIRIKKTNKIQLCLLAILYISVGLLIYQTLY